MLLWSEDFAPFTLLHATSAAFFLSCLAAFLLLAHRVRNTPHERTLRRAWIVFLIAFQAFSITWYALPIRFDIGVSLPLQMCDVVPLVAIPALITRSRPLLAVVLYWGLALCTQAFITPTLQYGPASIRFWLFWITHTQIVASALYAPVALNFVPTARDLRSALLALIPYGILILAVNAALETNYAFAGRTKPSNPTILDHLGEWPMRPVYLTLLATAALVAVHVLAMSARRLCGAPRAAHVPIAKP